MGTIIHRTVTGVVFDKSSFADSGDKANEQLAAFRESMPEEYRYLLVGPVSSVANFYATWTMLPDGSKEGWGRSEEMNEWRQKFVEKLIEVGCHEITRTQFGECSPKMELWEYFESTDQETGELTCGYRWVEPQPSPANA